jgi:hypothetical protein
MSGLSVSGLTSIPRWRIKKRKKEKEKRKKKKGKRKKEKEKTRHPPGERRIRPNPFSNWPQRRNHLAASPVQIPEPW